MDRRRNWRNKFFEDSTSRHSKKKITENPECSPTSVEASGNEYEVFLSFMGEDTRKGFTDHLYHRMLDSGICVFKDNVSLPEGKEIAYSLSEAIKKSKISIPILSTNYAASKWCLDELVFMMECRKTRKQMVLPIFYDVTPSQVKKQSKSYAIAFSEHHKNYDGETVEKWRKSLVEVASLKGLELEKETSGHEAQLTKQIVAKVLSVLKKAHLPVPYILVGIDDQVNAIIDLLKLSASDVRIVGIWGMGGIGKTTLAKHVYNQILDEFECCSFLKDIRETSLQHKGIEGLQAQLYTNLSKVAHGHNFTSIDEGTSELKYRFREKKVLILLDDVDQIHQLNVLAAEVGWFGAGSRIIITTRISDILDVHPVSDVYEVKEMDQEDALRLFCRHAFRKDSPNDEFKSVVYDIVKTTGGLPLSLEVIGSFLSLKRKPIWEETLWKLKSAPKVEVQKRLQISYDMLDDDQKQMFLDVACLFIGEDIDVVMHVWKDRKFSAETGTDVLLACSLIKIGEDNRIWMHDQLRDLGREIVRKENYKQPGMRSRLWHVDEARDALEKQVIYIDNEALHLSFDSTRDNHIKNKQLRNFPNIWYLCLYDADLIGDFQHLLTNLRWFTWQYSSSKCCAININLEKLLVLDLSYSSKIRDDWEIWSSIQNAKKLRVLNLTSCMKVSTLDVSMLINLEKLILDNCASLKEISIGKLEDLLTLSMKNCRSVSTLDVSMLINLEELILDYCVRLKEISIGKLEDLLTLSMKNCSSINTLDVSMLINLEKLILDYCVRLKEISIGKLEDLLTLSMKNCSSVNILDVSMLINLEKLILDDCYDLKEISIGKLEDLLTLSMKNCKSVSTLDVSMLMNLEKLIIDDYYDLKEISISKLEGLLTLSMENCNSITELPIWSLPSLERLLLPNCQSIERLPDSMGKLKSLIELDLSGTFFPTLPNSICDLENLQILKITDSKICNLPNVILESERLHIIDNFLGWQYYLKGNKVQQVVDANTYIKMSRSLKGSKVLHELKFSGAGNHEHWTTCEILSRPDTLQLLHVLLCGSIEKLLIPSKLKFLLRLDFHDCEKLHQIEGLDELEALQELRVQSCGAIKKLPNLCKLKSLRILDCFDCEELEEIEGLDGLKSLEEFNLRKCRAIQKLPRLSNLQSLKILNFHGCEKLQELEGLDGLKSLEKFNLEKCRAIEKLASLSKLRSLKELNCHGCEKLQEIEGLDGLESLEEFNLEKCRAIEKLASLSKLKSLKILIFHGCEKLQEIEGLDGLEKLAHVNISGCKGLRHIPVLPRHFNWIHMKGCNSYEETHRSMEPKMLCCICQESGFFFNMKYFEEEVHYGNWDDVERYLTGFTKVDDNRYSMKIFFEIRKQKYLEASLDRRDQAKAVEILVKDLKVFATFNEELFKEITQLLTLENFRENEQLSKYGDTRSARAIMLVELKKLIEANPLFRDKLQLPSLKNMRLRTLINQSLNWQHQLCKNPRPNPDIKTLFVDHSCGQPNGARAP